MDFTSLYYFSELAKDLHVTRTANRLFISQQTLSNHIQRLEAHYGAQLLHRKPSLSLTTAGEAVLDFANAVCRDEDNLSAIISDITKHERGVIRFGASPLRMNTCLPAILPEFSARYPNVELRVTDSVTSRLEPMVMNSSLDFAITLNGAEDPKLIVSALMDDSVYLCVADSLLKSCCGESALALGAAAVSEANLADFSNLPFCIFDNRMGRHIQQCFDAANVVPRTYITSTNTQIGATICFQRLAACFLSQTCLVSRRHDIPEDINILPLYYKGRPLTQKLTLIRLKDHYLTQYSQFFLDRLFEHFASVEQVQIERKV